MTPLRQFSYLCRITILFLLIFSPGCSLNNSPDTSRVTVDLGLRDKGEVRSITGKDAAHADVTRIELTVSAPDMRTVTEDIPLATGKLTLNLPAGKARLFRVTAVNPYGNLGGSATADLEAGTPANLTIPMAYQYTDVTINVSYPDGVPGSSSLTYEIGITDSASSIPVYGPQGFPLGTPFQVPSGDGKDIEILVKTPSVTFRWAVTSQSLAPGESVSYSAGVTLYETKIIIPDPGSTGGGISFRRLAQMDEIGDIASWQIIDDVNIASTINSWEFIPWDVDFDKRGRLYIANNYTGTQGAVIRIDDIGCSNEIAIQSIATAPNIIGVAIDRPNDILYYISNNATGIYRVDINNTTNNAELTITAGITTKLYSGIAVDDTGLIYVSNNDPGNLGIFKIDPNAAAGSRVIDSYTTSLLSPRDVMIKSNFLYIADTDTSTTFHKIVQLNISDMSFNAELTNSGSYPMLGPQRFIAILNRRIYLIDENPDDFSGSIDKLIALDDIDGTGWTTSGSTGSGINQFYFFYGC